MEATIRGDLERLASAAVPLHRYSLSDGMAQALHLIEAFVRDCIPTAHIRRHAYPTGQTFGQWRVGPRWRAVRGELVSADGSYRKDLTGHPLEIILYSASVDRRMTKAELAPYVYTNPDVPDAIPYVYRQQYRFWENGWGIALRHSEWQQVPGGLLHVVIETETEPGTLEVLEVELPGSTPEGAVLLCCHVCHTTQANDGFSGALAALAAAHARATSARPLRRPLKLLFTTEVIGPVAWLASNPENETALAQVVCLSWCGQEGSIAFSPSRRPGRFDRIMRHVLRRSGSQFEEHPYLVHGIGDEPVFDSPGIEVPAACLQRRHPEKGYHTSWDCLETMDLDRVLEVGARLAEGLDVFDRDWLPLRQFHGMPCLAAPELQLYLEPPRLNGLPNPLFRSDRWPEGWDQHSGRLFRGLFLSDLDGQTTVFDLAERYDMPFDFLDRYLDEFVAKGLCVRADAGKGRGAAPVATETPTPGAIRREP